MRVCKQHEWDALKMLGTGYEVREMDYELNEVFLIRIIMQHHYGAWIMTKGNQQARSFGSVLTWT